jgi:hypothetical protein
MHHLVNLGCGYYNLVRTAEDIFEYSPDYKLYQRGRDQGEIIGTVILPHGMEGVDCRKVVSLGIKKTEFGDHHFGIDMDNIRVEEFHLFKNPVPFVEFGDPVFLGDESRHGGNPDNPGTILPVLPFGEKNRDVEIFRIRRTNDQDLVTFPDKSTGERVHRHGYTIDPGPVGIGKHDNSHKGSLKTPL